MNLFRSSKALLIKSISILMSTQLFGESTVVMPLLAEAMEGSWSKDGKAVFVCKFINAELNPNLAQA
jgi:hypothetical protein